MKYLLIFLTAQVAYIFLEILWLLFIGQPYTSFVPAIVVTACFAFDDLLKHLKSRG